MASRGPMRRRQSMSRSLLQRFMQGLLRLLFRFQGRRTAEAGFIFPTTVMLVLLVALTAGALTYRAYSRSTQVIVERQQQVIVNAATPAIDRAKAKLEYLFSRDTRPTPKVPPSDALENLLRATDANMLTNADVGGDGTYDTLSISPEAEDIYTIDGEQRIDLDGDNKLDNAWVFNADVDGDGQVTENEIVVYSILVDHKRGDIEVEADDQDKSDNLVVRNDPLTSQAADACPRPGAETETGTKETTISGTGWSRINAIKTEKTFQVDVYATVLPVEGEERPTDVVSTLEFQQIREASLANKWGAWFRYDLEATPGSEFNWNGAMHTQGSLFMGNHFNAYMISSTQSCAYGEGASEITLGQERPDTGFQGQLVSGNANNGFRTWTDTTTIHIDNEDEPKKPTAKAFSLQNDSVDGDAGDNANDVIADIYLDPIRLYVDDEYHHVNPDTWNHTKDPEDVYPGRVRNVSERELVRISLDDTYRADNRYGPNKVYDQGDDEDGRIPNGVKIGAPIEDKPSLTNDSNGLDGYWERRASNEGMRMIVGQRLELGNANGWNFDPRDSTIAANDLDEDVFDSFDPLYPPNQIPDEPYKGEHYQRKSLRDNLAAVQGMVVYHYEDNDSSGTPTPAVCLATTAHFGTYDAIANSRTFRQLYIGSPGATDVMTDFLTGNGTNGWQFNPVDETNSNMQNALDNLAHFAGDPDGGAPSFTPVQSSDDVHPYPYLAMWGDFSTLRRAMDSSLGGNDSLADTSTKETAACTLALLAYNLDAIKKEHDEAIAEGVGSVTYAGLAEKLSDMLGEGSEEASDTKGDRQQELFDGKVPTLEAWKNRIADADAALLFDIGWHHHVTERDRALGFSLEGTSDAGSPDYNAPTATYTVPPGGLLADRNGNGAWDDDELFYKAGDPYTTFCDPADLKTAYGITSDADALSLAIAMCQGPHYPALYYLFPTTAHDIDDSGSQPSTEDYIAKTVAYGETGSYQFQVVNPADIAAEPLTPTTTGGETGWVIGSVDAASDAVFGTIWGDGDTPDDRPWDIVVTDADGSSPAAGYGAPLLDKVVYSGRENMAIRLLDIHVEQLMSATNDSDTWFAGQDSEGLEHSGLTYAFREDATREDAIVRPTDETSDPAACFQYDIYKAYNSANDNCYFKTATDVEDWTDPPLGTDHGISLKPVDYVPDPMRKPYGFRLREGDDFGRPDDVTSGLTFISNNAVAIQGDFNRHLTVNEADPSDTEDQEEFKTPKIFDGTGDFYDDFYGRERDDVNDEVFAVPKQDHWRPAEVLGDSIYLFSNSYTDGFAEAGFASDAGNDNGGSSGVFQYQANQGSGLVSFQNMNRPQETAKPTDEKNRTVPTAAEFLREDPGAKKNGQNNAPQSPIYFDRNGDVYVNAPAGSDPPQWNKMQDYGPDPVGNESYEYYEMNDNSQTPIPINYRRYNLAPASITKINALLMSGIIPSRADQIYGGLHNFPRMDEDWDDVTLQIVGGFFQLFFSHTSTAPFDLDAWEYNETPTGQNMNGYYFNPDRIWGYDVALQYADPPPISSRFVSVGTPRSEFYRELPVNDPYIESLRCAKTADGEQVDPNATCD